MATHFSTLAWKIPWMEEPGRLQSMGSQRVRHDWATSLHSLHSLHTLLLEKEMTTHSSVLAWRIPWTEEPGGPWSMKLQRVGHDWSDWAGMHTCVCTYICAFLMAQMIKNQASMLETQVQSLDQEDPLEKGLATHSSILAWRIPWTEGPDGLQFLGSQRVRHDWVTSNFTFFHAYIHTHTYRYTYFCLSNIVIFLSLWKLSFPIIYSLGWCYKCIFIFCVHTQAV